MTYKLKISTFFLSKIFIMMLYVGVSMPTQAQTCTTKGNTGWPTTRNVTKWPFSRTSIWNMPIGCDAKYVHARIADTDSFTYDRDIIVVAKKTDPLINVYKSGEPSYGRNTKRCSGTKPIGNGAHKIHFPRNLVIPSVGKNHSSAILDPDGKHIYQTNALARCKAGGPIYGLTSGFFKSREDIYGSGIQYPHVGGHGGTGLSSIGGTIREGELTSSDPIRHVLKLNFTSAETYFNKSKAKCFPRWPAARCDNRERSGDREFPSAKVSAFKQGALLAIHKNATASGLGIKTKAGVKLFHALQDYGAYFVDDSGPNKKITTRHVFSAEESAIDGFEKKYGHPFEYSTEYGGKYNPKAGSNYYKWKQDINVLFKNLHVIDDNTSSRIGGRGTSKRMPLAPSLSKTASKVTQEQSSPNPPLLINIKTN